MPFMMLTVHLLNTTGPRLYVWGLQMAIRYLAMASYGVVMAQVVRQVRHWPLVLKRLGEDGRVATQI